MVGFRKEEFYIKKFGEEKGKDEYQRVLIARDKRQSRLDTGRGVEYKVYTEEDVLNGDAIKCQCCGYITSRLQWTHFKYKCIIKTSEEYLEKYPLALIVAPNLSKKTSMTLENMIELHGEINGKIKWEQYCLKQAETNSFEYKAEKYNISEDDFKKYNKSRAVTLENLIKKHGEDEGLKKWNDYCDRQKYTCSLEYFIEEYGEDEGLNRYTYWHEKRVCNGNGGISDAEEIVFDILDNYIGENVRQLVLKHDTIDKHYRYDYANVEKRKIIEFNGTYWHCDPRKYVEDYIHTKTKLTAGQIWARDEDKINCAKRLGYDIMIIWEKDWNTNQEKIISDVVSWWNR
jgi:hypothetical protein